MGSSAHLDINNSITNNTFQPFEPIPVKLSMSFTGIGSSA